MDNPQFYSGFVSLIGRPNVGKSTLMNVFVGEKISIVSEKPQTTRNKVRSILTQDNYQIVFIDTPGLHKPMTKLGEFMVKSAENALNEVDVVLFLTEPAKKIPPGDLAILERLRKVFNTNGSTHKIFLVINKIDTVDKPDLLRIIADYTACFPFQEIVPISALRGENTDDLLQLIRAQLPEGPKYFPEDQLTDQPERQIVAEMIREKALLFLQDEIPHGIAVEITAMRPRQNRDLVDVEATIFCEKDSHKAIVIGKGGDMLKKIGAAARKDAEALLGSPIYLQLWVKVKKNWRDNDFLLKNMGYDARQL